jgi:hypothetical protein
VAPQLMPSLLHLLNRGARCLLAIRAIFRLWRSMRRAWQSCGSDTIRSVLVTNSKSKPALTDDGLRGFEVKDPDGYVLFFGRPG